MIDEKKILNGNANRSREITRVSYNRLSRWYDLLSGKSEQAVCKDGLRKLSVKSGETVLEVGFGTGRNLVALARSVGASGRIYGIDLSEGMLAVAKARIHKAKLAERVELFCGDACKLPYGREMFDAVFCAFTLELFDTREIPQVLQEFRRVLRSPGRVGIVSMSGYGKSNIMTRLYGWAHEKFPDTIDCRPILVQKSLADAGIEVRHVILRSIWGLPVEVAVAVKGGEEKRTPIEIQMP